MQYTTNVAVLSEKLTDNFWMLLNLDFREIIVRDY